MPTTAPSGLRDRSLYSPATLPSHTPDSALHGDPLSGQGATGGFKLDVRRSAWGIVDTLASFPWWHTVHLRCRPRLASHGERL